MHTPRAATERFTTLDRFAIVGASFSALGLLGLAIAGRSFSMMFDDLASRATLPFLTKIATSVWFPSALALPVIGALAMALRRSAPLALRRLWILGAFVLGCASVALCLVGMYLPIFAIADAVKAE